MAEDLRKAEVFSLGMGVEVDGDVGYAGDVMEGELYWGCDRKEKCSIIEV